jgi:predicted enzyme related to lactoylglutathione lyase
VADVRREAEALADSGIVPLAPPFHVKTGWTVEIPDPFGNVIGLTDYTSAPDLAREP